jgi:hypothetical protein
MSSAQDESAKDSLVVHATEHRGRRLELEVHRFGGQHFVEIRSYRRKPGGSYGLTRILTIPAPLVGALECGLAKARHRLEQAGAL